MCNGIIVDFHFQLIFNNALGELAHMTFPQPIMSTLSTAIGPFGCALLNKVMDLVIELQRQTHKKIEWYEKVLYTALSPPHNTHQSCLQNKHKSSQFSFSIKFPPVSPP